MYISGHMKAILRLYSFASQSASRLKNMLYRRGILKPRRAPLPVISIGNISLGGTGKTPLALEVLAWLATRGRRPALVSRGYRGRWEEHGGVLSDGLRITGTWREGGDEPAMAARALSGVGVFVGADRLASCRRAAELGFDAVVLDDGFQHRRLGRELDIVIYSPSETGALRESAAGLKRADVILVERGEIETCLVLKLPPGAPGPPIPYSVVSRGFRDARTGQPVPAQELRDERLLAFCGIARPERFLKQLQAGGIAPAAFLIFPDHHAYPEASVEKIAAAARAAGAGAAVMTAKDAVKLADRRGFPGELRLRVLEIGLEIDPPFFSLLEAALGNFPLP
jgi:tetraacyldisaccharide 4'-kinase